ncbi:MAG: hypothetical protein GF308_04530 [Candidatus Heimdallarchaeota archaeon]|nr:hypothetical protein [Candidatus Heimdallarchaeota archaeon]
MAVITTTTVSVRCAGHNGRATLKEAVETGWRMCRICKSFICPSCIQEFDLKMNGLCPSFIFGMEKHDLSPGPIPVEEIMLFAKDNKTEGITGGLLEALFFEEEQRGFMPFYTEIDEKIPKEPTEEKVTENEHTKIQEEHWKSYGFVMTKRRRGKFVTWEKLG